MYEITIEDVRQGIKAVKNELETKGWIQGPFENEHGVCLAQATYVNRTGLHQNEVFWAVRGAICEQIDMNVVAWSEKKGRTKEQVMSMLDTVISVAEGYTDADIPRLLNEDI